MKMSDTVVITSTPVTWQQVVAVARKGAELALDEERWAGVRRARQVVDDLSQSGTPHYGINTGLGALCNVMLDGPQLARLSRHTLMSHACGVGEPLREEQVRAIMCAAVVNYSHGCSGVSPGVITGLLALLNGKVTPFVPARGSVGYLSHMAHIGLVLIGEGWVLKDGQRMPAAEALSGIGMAPATLGAKDGLSLVNGTPAMTGLACLALEDASRLADWADVIGAMSFEALQGQLAAFSESVISRKAHAGVQVSGRNLRRLLSGSQRLANSEGHHLQDALSLRSMPQVHGAYRDQLVHAIGQINGELASATDNPLIVSEGGEFRIVSQANPHGESVAMACDLLSIAVCELSSISERRGFRLVTPQANELPPFLTEDSGVKSGMMIAQYTAASLVADNKRLAQPAVTDNYMTSGLQEDHVSFGETSALKLDTALGNARYVLAIEYIFAAQAFDLIKDEEFGEGTTQAWKLLRERVPFYNEEHPLSEDITAAQEVIAQEV